MTAFSTVGDVLLWWTAVVVGFAAVVAAITVIAKSPLRVPAMFVLRRLFLEPASRWFQGEVRQVVRMELKRTKGGPNLLDLERQMTELRKYTHDGVHEVRGALTPIAGKVGVLFDAWEQGQRASVDDGDGDGVDDGDGDGEGDGGGDGEGAGGGDGEDDGADLTEG